MANTNRETKRKDIKRKDPAANTNGFRGRRTGITIRRYILKDFDGLDNVSDFFEGEDESGSMSLVADSAILGYSSISSPDEGSEDELQKFLPSPSKKTPVTRRIESPLGAIDPFAKRDKIRRTPSRQKRGEPSPDLGDRRKSSKEADDVGGGNGVLSPLKQRLRGRLSNPSPSPEIGSPGVDDDFPDVGPAEYPYEQDEPQDEQQEEDQSEEEEQPEEGDQEEEEKEEEQQEERKTRSGSTKSGAKGGAKGRRKRQGMTMKRKTRTTTATANQNERLPKKPRRATVPKKSESVDEQHISLRNAEGTESRRSSRKRIAPLEWWKNEKVVYRRRDSAIHLPHVVEVIKKKN